MDTENIHLLKVSASLGELLHQLELDDADDQLTRYIIHVKNIKQYILTILSNSIKRQQMQEEEIRMSIASMHILRGGKIV